ncbi:MAG TPA: hypothetical protein PKE52_06310 [Bacteroidales bacterium]|nr:hypothetical protein [Bacteroidales bacterium]
MCDLRPSHLDAPLCYTWTDKLKPFSPSRLDYILYTAETIGSLKSFVYNIPGFFIDDFNSVSFTANRDRSVSDHFPVVSDFIIYSSSSKLSSLVILVINEKMVLSPVFNACNYDWMC